MTIRQLGFGLGLRPDHYDAVLGGTHRIDWFEVTTENYLVPGGKPLRYLERVRARYPLVMHGVSLSVGSTAPLDPAYLRSVRGLRGGSSRQAFPTTSAGPASTASTCTTCCRCRIPPKRLRTLRRAFARSRTVSAGRSCSRTSRAT